MRGVPPAELTLKVGARVVVTRNIDVVQGVVNGTIGTVENIQPNLITVRRCKDGELMCVQPIKHRIKLIGTSCIVERQQFPLILAWAVTVHRVQGMTLSSNVFVYMDKTFFANGQAYVALSRVKAYDQLHLLSFDPVNAIKVSHTVRGLYGLPRLQTDPSSSRQFTPMGMSAAGGLPAITTRECMRYLRDNLNDDARLSEYMEAHSQAIEALIADLQSTDVCSAPVFSPVVRIGCISNLHPALVGTLIPIETTADGNCFWHAVSIVLCGRERLSLTLFITAYGLIKYRREFINPIMLDSIYEHAPNHTEEHRYREC